MLNKEPIKIRMETLIELAKEIGQHYKRNETLLERIRVVAKELHEDYGVTTTALVEKVKKEVEYFKDKSDSTVYRMLFNKSQNALELHQILNNAIKVLERKWTIFNDKEKKAEFERRLRKLIEEAA
jgi:hypothetical protein